MPVSKVAKRVARRFLEGLTKYPVRERPPEDTPDLDTWRERPAVPDGDRSALPGDEDAENAELDGQTGKRTR